MNNTERIVSVMCSLLKVVFKGGFLQYSIERMNTGPNECTVRGSAKELRSARLFASWKVCIEENRTQD